MNIVVAITVTVTTCLTERLGRRPRRSAAAAHICRNTTRHNTVWAYNSDQWSLTQLSRWIQRLFSTRNGRWVDLFPASNNAIRCDLTLNGEANFCLKTLPRYINYCLIRSAWNRTFFLTTFDLDRGHADDVFAQPMNS